jgi:hypothetical protein
MGFDFVFPLVLYPGTDAPASGPLAGPTLLGLRYWPQTAVVPVTATPADYQARLLQTLSRGEVGQVMDLFADEARYSLSDGIGVCSATPCSGKTAIQAELARQIGVKTRFVPLSLTTTGNLATGLWDARSDRVQAAGAHRALVTITSEVRDGKTVSMSLVLVRDDPQTARFIEWVRTQPASSSAPAGAPASGGPAAGATAADDR